MLRRGLCKITLSHVVQKLLMISSLSSTMQVTSDRTKSRRQVFGACLLPAGSSPTLSPAIPLGPVPLPVTRWVSGKTQGWRVARQSWLEAVFLPLPNPSMYCIQVWRFKGLWRLQAGLPWTVMAGSGQGICLALKHVGSKVGRRWNLVVDLTEQGEDLSPGTRPLVAGRVCSRLPRKCPVC